MSLSLITTLVVRAAEEGGEPAVNPWIVGGLVLLLLVGVLAAVVGFGGGREHS